MKRMPIILYWIIVMKFESDSCIFSLGNSNKFQNHDLMMERKFIAIVRYRQTVEYLHKLIITFMSPHVSSCTKCNEEPEKLSRIL